MTIDIPKVNFKNNSPCLNSSYWFIPIIAFRIFKIIILNIEFKLIFKLNSLLKVFKHQGSNKYYVARRSH